jgi:AraC-like DNA-binding protein
MTPHDFDVGRDATEFVLVLHDPAQERRLPLALQSRLARGPLLLRADPALAARIEMLASWLVETTTPARNSAPGHWSSAHLLDLLLALVAEHGRPISGDNAPVPGRRDPLARLERAVSLIHANPARALTLTEAAQACHLSPAYFARLFKARMGQTFADYLQNHRLNLAAQLAASSELGIAEIAWRTGFGSPAHLSTRFSAHFGLSPSRYRAAARLQGQADAPSKGQDGTRVSQVRGKPAPSRGTSQGPMLAPE